MKGVNPKLFIFVNCQKNKNMKGVNPKFKLM